MNLTMGGHWQLVSPATGWTTMPASRLDSLGTVKSLGANEQATLVMSYPPPSSSGKLFRCTYAGTGALTVRGASISQVKAGNHQFEFRWTLDYPNPNYAWLELNSTNAKDPVRRVDCREADASPTQRFSTEFIESLRPYGTIRFLDWSSANGLTDGKWNNRTRPDAMVTGSDGVAIEDMAILLRTLKADGWFTLPWKADTEYVQNFANYIHKAIPADQTVYVEVANEVWNGFPAGLQAEREGIAEGLHGTSNFDIRMHRYAEKTNAVMKIWTKVFADRPNKLVRVIGSQGVNFGVTQAVLAYSDPKLIDAVAVAPYFGYDLFDDPANKNASVGKLTLSLATKADQTIETMKHLKATYITPAHKRLITYEAGQHVITPNVALARSIERHPKMYDIYKRYLERWQNEVGDLMMLYNSTTPVTQYGSWGLREYNEQPLTKTDTPKRLAAVYFAQGLAKQGK